MNRSSAMPQPRANVSKTMLNAALSALCALMLLGGCSWGGKDDDEEVTTNEMALYQATQRMLRSGNYSQAIEGLERLEARFPFGRYAEQAQLELIFARYMSFDPDGARAAADRFIRLHPNHASVDYAYYLKGLAAFHRNRGLMDRFFTSDPSRRDMTPPREAYADFAQLLARYPESQYAPDAQQRMVYLRNLLSRHELGVADYYLRRNAHVAAANRARFVLENYPQSESVPDALAIIVECNWRLGLTDAADDALRVLALNYPTYPAFDREGSLVLAERIRNRDRSWTNLVTFGLLGRPEVPPPLRIRTESENQSAATSMPVRVATE